MKHHALLSISLLVSTVPCAIASEPIPDGHSYEEVKAYFQQCLEGQRNDNYSPAGFFSEYTVGETGITDVTSKIWEIWASVNKNFSEDKPKAKLYDIGTGAIWSYTLPKELEIWYANAHPGETPLENAKMKYLFGSKGSSQEPRPLIIMLHGSGPVSDEWSAIQQVSRTNPDAPSVYFTPQIPNGAGEYYRWYHRSKQWVWEKLFRQMFLRDDIDGNKMYFAGISEGAYGSQRLASFYADYLAGAGPMAGGEQLTNAPAENLANTYFNLRTGSNDTGYYRHALTKLEDEYLNALAANDPFCNYAHDVTLLDGYGHSIPYDKTTPALLGHSRSVNPKHVRWENFAMDGRFRTGFYNLHVIERSEDPTSNLRSYYKLDIDGNDISLDVSTVRTTVTEKGSYYGWSVDLDIRKDYTPATKGKIKIYLNEDLTDISKPVTLRVNGTEVYSGTVVPNLEDMVNSCAEFYDPKRVFPCSVTVDLSTMEASGSHAGIGTITEEGAMPATEYYNMQGMLVWRSTGEETVPPLSQGIYIKRQGNKSTKICIR